MRKQRLAAVAVIIGLAFWTVVLLVAQARAVHGVTPGCVSYSEFQATFRWEAMTHFTYRVGPDPQYEVVPEFNARYYRTCEDQTRADAHVMILKRIQRADGTWCVDNARWTEIRDLKAAAR